MRGGGGGVGLGALVATTGGLKAGGQVAEEGRINAGVAQAGGTSTFATLRDFNDFSRGLELLPALAADSAGPGPGSATLAAAAAAADGPRTATRLGEPRAPVRVWAAALPPSAISLPPSALAGLRGSVRSTASTQPDFARSFRPLDSHDLAQKQVLGQALDVSRSLARVEPVRGTKVLNRDDYVAWGDYAAGCRTTPAGWDSAHPAAAAQDTGGHRYPWG
ncbi:hypothetical protein TSOC_013385 [Tetrabaena socialis]|uniref:Uncharacterized protein n=1 Tax=Tetrabaena socialis TaxID=47790 RepID=A0A2J7ZKH7_9CHLO|nr:hypothetical protein TSOC_013385 [Tetrabaena socialis]|eukprot:PNH00775.1 hypothetical protein TSOC_013385 [Tetrabaena socialis]